MLLVLALKIKKIEGGKAARAGTRQLAAFFFFFFFLAPPMSTPEDPPTAISHFPRYLLSPPPALRIALNSSKWAMKRLSPFRRRNSLMSP